LEGRVTRLCEETDRWILRWDPRWFEGGLYVLMRERRMVLRVEPPSHRVLAEYDFSALENQAETAYRTVMRYPTSTMEGLAVSREGFWLVTDNNGLGRLRHPEDIRPTLFFCPWPGGAR
jgi:glutamine cyclotransferase